MSTEFWYPEPIAVPSAPVTAVDWSSEIVQLYAGSEELSPQIEIRAASRYLQFVVHIVPEAPICVKVVGAT